MVCVNVYSLIALAGSLFLYLSNILSRPHRFPPTIMSDLDLEIKRQVEIHRAILAFGARS